MASPYKKTDGKYKVEDREDGTTGNAERSALADEFLRLLRLFMEQLNRRATEAALGQEAASATAVQREELAQRERTYLGDAMTDFQATSFQGRSNDGRMVGDTDVDYDEEEDREREPSTKQRRRSGALKRARWASVGHNGGVPPGVLGVGGANDPFLAGVLEQARLRDAALAEQQQEHTTAIVAAVLSKQRGGCATAFLTELRSIKYDLRLIGEIDDSTAANLRIKARADFL